MQSLTGISEAEYHGWDMMSASALKTLDKSTPLHLTAERENHTDTPAFRIGRALHSLLLTPQAYEHDFVTAPDIDRRTKAGKEEWEKFQQVADGRTVLTQEESNLVETMGRAVRGCVTASQLLDACSATELTLRGDWDGVPCKARLDGWIEDHGTIIDIKTHTGVATASDFARAAHSFGYWTQFAFYREMMRKAGKEVSSVILIVVEKGAPHRVRCVAMHPEHLDLAATRLPELVDLYRYYQQNPTQGWVDTVTEIRLPNWASNDFLAPTGA
jgi:exodeoxyribonuclease VIII